MDFQVISKIPRTNEVVLAPPQPPKILTGVGALFQLVVLSLLNIPGRNAQFPLQGSGIPAMIGQVNLSEKDSSEVFALLVNKVEKVKNEIIENQKSLKKEPLDGMLSDLVILSIESGETADVIRIRFRLVTQAGTIEEFVI